MGCTVGANNVVKQAMRERVQKKILRLQERESQSGGMLGKAQKSETKSFQLRLRILFNVGINSNKYALTQGAK